jgi:uncharacterized protein (TIGR03086 family)
MHMQMIKDIRPFHRTAILASVDLVATVSPSHLDLPTPCAAWDLGDLLAHMTVQHRGFAAAARGCGADLAVWQPATVADAVAADPAGTYAKAADNVIQAFAADDVLEATFALPELGTGTAFPGALAIGFHFVDYVVHGWDIARSIGANFELPADVVAAVLPLALAVPGGAARTGDGAAFGPAITATGEAGDLDRIVAYLGRSPEWTSPSGSRSAETGSTP